MSFLWRGYISLLKRYTLPTQMATGGFTSALGDVIYQQGIERKGWEKHEMFRTRRLAIYGGIIFAPCMNRWHTLVLNRIVLSGRWSTVATRVVVDQTLFAPFATSLFYCTQGVMESRPWSSSLEADGVEGIRERLSQRLVPTVLKQWMVFGPSGAINLAFIPLYARPPFANVFACGWSVYLAYAQSIGSISPERMAIELSAAEAFE